MRLQYWGLNLHTSRRNDYEDCNYKHPRHKCTGIESAATFTIHINDVFDTAALNSSPT